MKISTNINAGCKKTATGRTINEDGLKIVDIPDKNIKIIVMMDGATGLGRKYEIEPGMTPAEWYVKEMLKELTNEFLYDPTISLESAVENGIKILKNKITKYEQNNDIKLLKYEEPSAGISIVRIDDKITEIYNLGDTTTIIGYKNGEIQKIKNPNEEKLKAYDKRVIEEMVIRAKTTKRNVVETRDDGEIQMLLKQNRNQKNGGKAESYYVCGTDIEAVKHGIHYLFPNNKLKRVINITDGLEYNMLGEDEVMLYNRLNVDRPEDIIKEIRKLQEEDSLCNKYPRLKKSDDITFVVVDYDKE